ncbi:outer membrane beta-barrel protein [Polluticoccus soli]|uniref:outer membrane beta-barrel protein n=1 Tax=Polluticoccus soli TaxID=3034150 RepID=UPI0023E19F89|nr:outer membrane beta-barrel protein [Flavipsychrobacter sp. JY13-12]
MISKKLRLAFIGLLFPAFSFAQALNAVTAASPVDIDLGVKLGANFSKLQGSIFDDTYRTGFLGGAFGGVKFGKYGVSAELLYSRTRFTYNPSSLPSSFFKNASDTAKENSFAVSNLSIPILFNIKLVGPLWFQVGPQYTNLISIGDENGLLKDVNDVFKNGDISGVAGLQANISKINIGARYIMGFSNMNGSGASGVTDSWKNRTIQLHVGYAFL